VTHRRLLRARVLLHLLVLCSAATATAAGQAPVPDIRLSSARVKSIGFRFSGSESFTTTELGGVLALKGRGSFYRVRRILGELPLIGSPGSQRFDPIELQKDVVRLTRFYQRSGFLHPAIDYELKANSEGTLVDVTFTIDEGPAVTLRDLWIATRAGDADANLPASLLPAWTELEAELNRARGHRFGDAEAALLKDRTRSWLQDNGYPLPKVQVSRQVDSNQVDVTIRVQPGQRRRIGSIDVKGNQSVGDRVVLRELPFQKGDWYSAASLATARMRLQQIDLFRQTTIDVEPGSDADTTVGIQVQVLEAGPRLSLAELGYISEGAGLSGRVQWDHPNFTGGARTLTTSLEIQSGAWALTGQAEKLLRGSVSLTQPYVHVPQLSLVVGPFAEYRDDLEDRSIDLGLSTILLYRLGGFSSVALEYRYSASHIYEYRFGNSSSGTINLGELLALQAPALLDSLGRDVDRSSLALSGSFSKLDDLANPRRGWSIRPRAELTLPAALTTVQFGRLDVTLSGYHPLTRKVGLAARLSAGRLFPFGKSVPGPQDNPAYSLIRLRDETLTAGGTDDVRGWASRLLGPKFPDIEANVEGADTVLSADRYAPVGALARLTGTLELRLPCPWLSSAWGTELFLDAGRVWTPDERFNLPVLEGDTDVRFSTGAGLSYLTPVGAVRLSLGYKLNPSDLDLRDANDVLNALLQGLRVTTAEPDWSRRLHLHLSFGMTL
jgi:outer membrane protein insertion porin family